MLTGALTHKTYQGRNARERDLVHLAELIQSHVCKGNLGRALQVMGWMQYVHVSDPPHEWLQQMIFDESDHDLFGTYSSMRNHCCEPDIINHHSSTR